MRVADFIRRCGLYPCNKSRVRENRRSVTGNEKSGIAKYGGPQGNLARSRLPTALLPIGVNGILGGIPSLGTKAARLSFSQYIFPRGKRDPFTVDTYAPFRSGRIACFPDIFKLVLRDFKS